MKLKKFQIGGIFKALASNPPISSDSYIQQAYQQDFTRRNNLPADYFTVSNEQRGQYNEQWKQRAQALDAYKQEEKRLKDEKMRRQYAMVPINLDKEPTEAFQEGGKFYEDLPDSEKWDLQYNASITMPKGWGDPDGWLDKYLKARGIQRREAVSTEDVINAGLGTKISKGIDKVNNYLDTRFPVLLKHMSPGFDYAYKQKETKDKKSQETKPQNKKSSSLETPKKKLVQKVPKNQEGAKFGGSNKSNRFLPQPINQIPELTVNGHDKRWRFSTRQQDFGNGHGIKSQHFYDAYDGGNYYLGDASVDKGGRTIYYSPQGNDTIYWNTPTEWIWYKDGLMPIGKNEVGAKANFFKNLKRPLIKEQKGGHIEKRQIPTVDYYNVAMQPIIQSLRVPATAPFK